MGEYRKELQVKKKNNSKSQMHKGTHCTVVWLATGHIRGKREGNKEQLTRIQHCPQASQKYTEFHSTSLHTHMNLTFRSTEIILILSFFLINRFQTSRIVPYT